MSLRILISCDGSWDESLPCRAFLTLPFGNIRVQIKRAGWLRAGGGRHLCHDHHRLWRAEQLALHGHVALGVDDMGWGPVPDAEAVRFICWCPDGEECPAIPPRDAPPASTYGIRPHRRLGAPTSANLYAEAPWPTGQPGSDA